MDPRQSMRTVSFRAWRDAASLLAMGRQRVQAMDAEETGAQQITDVVSESVGQGRAQQRAFYENLVTNCGIPDQELQHHVSLIRAQLAEFNSAYRDQPFVVSNGCMAGGGGSSRSCSAFVEVDPSKPYRINYIILLYFSSN